MSLPGPFFRPGFLNDWGTHNAVHLHADVLNGQLLHGQAFVNGNLSEITEPEVKGRRWRPFGGVLRFARVVLAFLKDGEALGFGGRFLINADTNAPAVRVPGNDDMFYSEFGDGIDQHRLHAKIKQMNLTNTLGGGIRS